MVSDAVLDSTLCNCLRRSGCEGFEIISVAPSGLPIHVAHANPGRRCACPGLCWVAASRQAVRAPTGSRTRSQWPAVRRQTRRGRETRAQRGASQQCHAAARLVTPVAVGRAAAKLWHRACVVRKRALSRRCPPD